MGSRATLVKTLGIFVLALYVVVPPVRAQQDQGGTPNAPAADEPQTAQQQEPAPKPDHSNGTAGDEPRTRTRPAFHNVGMG